MIVTMKLVEVKPPQVPDDEDYSAYREIESVEFRSMDDTSEHAEKGEIEFTIGNRTFLINRGQLQFLTDLPDL